MGAERQEAEKASAAREPPKCTRTMLARGCEGPTMQAMQVVTNTRT